MSMLNTNHLFQVRRQHERSMPEVVDLLSLNRVSDGDGGMVETFQISHSGVKARIAERTGKETTFMGREDVLADYVLTLPHDQTVSETMRIDHGGRLYEIAFVNTDRSYDTARRCLIRRIP